MNENSMKSNFGRSEMTLYSNEYQTINNYNYRQRAGSRQCGVSWNGDQLGLLNMGTKIEDNTCYRPHMRLPAGRYAA